MDSACLCMHALLAHFYGSHHYRHKLPQAAKLLPCHLQSTKFMLGIIIAVICSNWVGDWILSEGVYETDLERDGSVVFLRPSPPVQLFKKRAGDLMAAPAWYSVAV